MKHLVCTALAVAGGVLYGADATLVLPGRDHAIIDTPHLHALVPADQAEQLRPLIQRADGIYVHLARDAGYTIQAPLSLLVGDDVDDHNGFSTVVPRPLIQIELAPALPRSGIFDGDDVFLRTFIHEATHHLSNDRPHKVSAVTERIFGRVMPDEPLSLLAAYFTIPPHATSPFFWHEGLAQWAETQYADPASAWGGRGRDSLTHMVWRLDADAGAIPPVGEWRRGFQRWPYGNRVYLYGLAYTRWLQAAYGGQVPLWKAITGQGKSWPFFFDRGARQVYGRNHAGMIAEARQALLTEQEGQLARLRQATVTDLKRLTPGDTAIGAPAWLADGRLFAAWAGAYDTPSFAVIDGDGTPHQTWRSAYARGEVRNADDGAVIWSEPVRRTGSSGMPSRLHLRTPGGFITRLPGERLLQPALRTVPSTNSSSGLRHYQVAALRLGAAGRHELILRATVVGDDLVHQFLAPGDQPWTTVATQGQPWSPVFRPRHDDLVWVETDAAGSRLVLAPLGDPDKRTILAQVRGRIIHPVFSADGAHLYFCADHTGVANAYRVAVQDPALVPITNVIGGVIACVPSPDGRQLALVAFDREGSFLAKIANDPATWAKEVPALTLAWPAPVPATTVSVPLNTLDGEQPTPLPKEPANLPDATISPYHGLAELRPLFWTPTTLVTPEGGLGVVGKAADPLNTHQALASVGIGDTKSTPVGLAAYIYAPYTLQAAAAVWRSERTWNDRVVDSGGVLQDYTENIETAEGRVGYGLAGNVWRMQSYLAVGVSRWKEAPASAEDRNGRPIVSQQPFAGQEQYVEVALARSSSNYFPTSYTTEAGTEFALVYRHSGLGGELARRKLTASLARVWSVWPEAGHQVVTAGSLGWSDADGDQILQSQFAVGGPQGYNRVRGYPLVASGPYLATYTLAYRLPVWRPFQGFGTTPFAIRQLVLEGFTDAGKISPDRILGEGNWIRSAGGELHANLEAWALDLNPGLGVAKQLDVHKDTRAYLTLAYQW